ncbi:MAG: translation initiation factor [Brumimicrobium sp.]|nr:translation initiation factor [Brumimicrobium sp.]
MGKNKKNKEGGMVYSTNRDLNFDFEEEDEELTLPPEKQTLYISIDRKQRKGKDVTLIQGFKGSDFDLAFLAKKLKNACGVGGTAKEGEILIQGNFRDKIIEILSKEGYGTKRKGG